MVIIIFIGVFCLGFMAGFSTISGINETLQLKRFREQNENMKEHIEEMKKILSH